VRPTIPSARRRFLTCCPRERRNGRLSENCAARPIRHSAPRPDRHGSRRKHGSRAGATTQRGRRDAALRDGGAGCRRPRGPAPAASASDRVHFSRGHRPSVPVLRRHHGRGATWPRPHRRRTGRITAGRSDARDVAVAERRAPAIVVALETAAMGRVGPRPHRLRDLATREVRHHLVLAGTNQEAP
jgi:hypothetical protein